MFNIVIRHYNSITFTEILVICPLLSALTKTITLIQYPTCKQLTFLLKLYVMFREFKKIRCLEIIKIQLHPTYEFMNVLL